MAVSKTLRFEILRRDGFRCTYCGAQPSDGDHVRLNLDHVLPVSLGGRDTSENVVTACGDCNAGKGRSRMDSPTLPDVSDASRGAWVALTEDSSEPVITQDDYTDCVYMLWWAHAHGYSKQPGVDPMLPLDWEDQVRDLGRPSLMRWHHALVEAYLAPPLWQDPPANLRLWTLAVRQMQQHAKRRVSLVKSEVDA